MLQALGDQPLENFDWPTEAELARFRQCNDLNEFLEWMCSAGETGDLRVQRVHSLHVEWCCLYRWRPLSPKALSHRLKKLGVEKSRPRVPRTQSGVPRKRPTSYRIGSRQSRLAEPRLAA